MANNPASAEILSVPINTSKKSSPKLNFLNPNIFPKRIIYLNCFYTFENKYYSNYENENSNNLATPGKPMSQKKLASLIKEAEEGVFYTLEESKKRFEEWRKKAVK